MGFSVYHQSNDWKPSDFDTGASKVYASLANIPRQIFEGIQVGKENDLREREMANREAKTKQDEEQSRAQMEFMKQKETNDETRHRELMDFNQATRREDLDLKKQEFEEDKKERAMRIKYIQAQIKEKEGNGTLEGYKNFLNSDYATKKDNVTAFVVSNDIFTNKDDNDDLKKLIVAGVDPSRAISSIAIRRRGELGVFDTGKLSLLSPMLSDLNKSSDARWLVLNKHPDPNPRDDFRSVLNREAVVQKSISRLNENDPRVNEALALYPGQGSDLVRFKAALGDALSGSGFNKEIYDPAILRTVKKILSQVATRKTDEKKKEKKAENEAYWAPRMGGF